MSSSALAAGLRHLRRKLALQQPSDDSDEQLLDAFTNLRDEAAFAVLMHRHGPMVFHVCRRVLGHEQDAEDAFQATFLVLARNSAGLRNKMSLAGFLHGIAYRTAMKAKQAAARRRKHEGSFGSLSPNRSLGDPTDELSWREVRGLLDEEIVRLPETCRSVFILCCLENRSQAEVGRRLGLKQRTVSNRLAAARKRLAQRLSRRGLALTAVLASSVLVAQPASALPAGLMASTIKAALVTAAGKGLAGVVSLSVAELVKGMTPTMLVSKAKIATLSLLAAALMAGVGAWTCRSLATTQPEQPRTEKSASPPHPTQDRKAETPRQDKSDRITLTGRVLDPEGKPAAGVRVYMNPIRDLADEGEVRILSTPTEKDGHFSLVVPQADLIAPKTQVPHSIITIVATAKGYGPDWRDVPLDNSGKDVTLRLVKDDVPIQGRILSLEGKPLAGIKVSVKAIETFPRDDLSRALQAAQNGIQFEIVTDVQRLWPATADPGQTAMTDADGRFHLDGIGRERIARLHLESSGIHYSSLEVMTRKGVSIQGPKKREPIHAAKFEYLAKPSRLIRGTVREKGTGKLLAGIGIMGNKTTARAVTDALGRFELLGCAKGDRYGVMAYPTHGQPYFVASVAIKDTEGLGPLTADLEMVSGIPFGGRVLDGETGQPVLGRICYFPLAPNPNVTDNLGGGAANAIGPYNEASISADGSFHCIVLPGPGFIGVRARNVNRYTSACVDPRAIKAKHNMEILAIPFKGGMLTMPQDHFQGILLLNPDKDSKTISQVIHLKVAPGIKGMLLDPDGKPVTGARVRGLEDAHGWGTLADEKFRIVGVNPQRPRRVTFLHTDRRLIGSVEVNGSETESLTVRMQSWVAVCGRLVDAEGRPVRQANLDANEFLPENGRTNEQGRFRLEGLIPGLRYNLTYAKDKPSQSGTLLEEFVGKPGEVRDLGDVRGQPIRWD